MLSEVLKYNEIQQVPTLWKAKNMHQQAWNAARHSSDSLSEKSGTEVINRLEIKSGMAVTYKLESQIQILSIELKHSMMWQ